MDSDWFAFRFNKINRQTNKTTKRNENPGDWYKNCNWSEQATYHIMCYYYILNVFYYWNIFVNEGKNSAPTHSASGRFQIILLNKFQKYQNKDDDDDDDKKKREQQTDGDVHFG